MGARHVTNYEYDKLSGRLMYTVETPEWTEEDRELAFALEEWEAGLCPGCQQPLSETSKPEHKDAYVPTAPIRCHYCTVQAQHAETMENQSKKIAGLLFSYHLDPDVVQLNLQPVPPLPPELQGET